MTNSQHARLTAKLSVETEEARSALLQELADLGVPLETPWGFPQKICLIAPGIILISTASHGGYYLSPERNKQVPKKVKARTFLKNGFHGWYEEDEDASVVERVFAEAEEGRYSAEDKWISLSLLIPDSGLPKVPVGPFENFILVMRGEAEFLPIKL